MPHFIYKLFVYFIFMYTFATAIKQWDNILMWYDIPM